MVALIELPDNKNETAFILEVLKRLNVRVFENDTILSDNVLAEHARILHERRATLNAPETDFLSWEAAQNELTQRKKVKTTL